MIGEEDEATGRVGERLACRGFPLVINKKLHNIFTQVTFYFKERIIFDEDLHLCRHIECFILSSSYSWILTARTKSLYSFVRSRA